MPRLDMVMVGGPSEMTTKGPSTYKLKISSSLSLPQTSHNIISLILKMANSEEGELTPHFHGRSNALFGSVPDFAHIDNVNDSHQGPPETAFSPRANASRKGSSHLKISPSSPALAKDLFRQNNKSLAFTHSPQWSISSSESNSPLYMADSNPRRSESSTSLSKESEHPGRPSVKHLTCYWWKVKGTCRYDEEHCLYSHHDTGKVADAPRHLVPGEKAMAGRNLEARLAHYRTSTPADAQPSEPSWKAPHGTSEESTTQDLMSYPGLSAPNTTTEGPQSDIQTLQNNITLLQNDKFILQNFIASCTRDKDYFKNQLIQSSIENRSLQHTIQGLQTEKNALLAEIEGLQNQITENVAEKEDMERVLRQSNSRIQHLSAFREPLRSSASMGSFLTVPGPGPIERPKQGKKRATFEG